MTERIQYIDTAKGLCIILVVFFHVKGVLGCNYYMDPFLVSFRMPLYFVLSGLFFKDYGSLAGFLKKKTNNLLIPFFFFYITCSVLLPNVLHTFFGKTFNTVTGWPSLWAFVYPGMYPNVPIWFLWCLFLINLLFWIVQHTVVKYLPKYEDEALMLISLLLGFSGYYLIAGDFIDYGRSLTALENIPFFCVGYLFRKHEGLSFLQNMSQKRVLFWVLSLFVIVFLLTIVWPSSIGISYYLCGLGGTLLVLMTARQLGNIPFISYIGRYSIIVLVTHGMLMWATNRLYPFLAILTGSADVATFMMTGLTLLSYYLIIPLMCRFFPYVTAQRPVLS